MNQNQRLSPEQWMRLTDGQKSPLSPEAMTELRRGLDELRKGLVKQNLAAGRDFGGAIYEALEQCKMFIDTKNKKNPAAEFLIREHAAQKSEWSREIMMSPFRHRTLHECDPEEVKDIKQIGANQAAAALKSLNEKLREYDQPVAAQQSEMGAKPRDIRQTEKPRIQERTEQQPELQNKKPEHNAVKQPEKMKEQSRPQSPMAGQPDLQTNRNNLKIHYQNPNPGTQKPELQADQHQLKTQQPDASLPKKEPVDKAQQLKMAQQQLMWWVQNNQNYRVA